MTSFGRYQLQGTQGEGGFATVYRAYDPALGRMVALKALHPRHSGDDDIRRRFINEARLLAGLHHPNIVTVHDVGEADGRPFFTMEMVAGETLADRIRRAGSLPLEEARRIVGPLAAALDALHAAGLVHRDLKPANVMIEPSGRVVLMDFGISRSLDSRTHTATGLLMGTPGYMAPEQVLGQPTSPATDIYALGVLTYEMLAGRLPFAGDTVRVLHAHAYEPPPLLHDLAPALPESAHRVVDAALSKDPSARPASAGRFAAMLGDIGDAQTLTYQPTQQTPAKRWLAIGAVAAFTAMMIGAVLVGLNLRTDPAPAGAQSRATAVPSVAPRQVAPPLPSQGATSQTFVPVAPVAPSVVSEATAATRTTALITPSPVPTPDQAQVIRTVIDSSHDVWSRAMAQGGTTALLGDVYAEPRLSDVSRLVQDLRASGEYCSSTRKQRQFESVMTNTPDEATAVTTETWETLCYARDGTLIENRTEAARDTYSLRRTTPGWRIIADRVERLSLTQGPLPAQTWIVVVESLATSEGKTRQDADRQAAQMRGRGEQAAVLLSTDYPRLNPGYWVVYSREFSNRADANAHAQYLRGRGYAAPYPRQLR